ncbi:MAG: IS1380 family transposase [Lentisphaerota bacterium]
MNQTKNTIHPEGEDDIFEFPTYCGKVFLHPSEEALTPYGGLIPFAAFQKQTGIIEQLAKTCPVVRTSPNASSLYDIIATFGITVLSDGRRFTHANRIGDDKSIAEVFGMKRASSDDTIRRLFYSIEESAAKNWINSANRQLWGVLPDKFILDWDSTVQTKYGHQEGAEVGYNPTKKGRKSYHPLMAVASSTRLCLYYRWRPGDSSSAGEFTAAIDETMEMLGGLKSRLWLNRGDKAFGTDANMLWHEKGADKPKYLFKLKITSSVKRAFSSILEDQWQGNAAFGVLQTAEADIQLDGWNCPRRVILGRRNLGTILASRNNSFWDETKYEFEAYVTNLSTQEANSWQVVDLYRKRADCENVFDELKNQWGFNGFTCRKSTPTSIAARLMLIFYNLWVLFMRLISPEKHIEMISGRRWFLLIAARMTKSSRQREVHLSVGKEFWKELKQGYARVYQWIKETAPQLDMFGLFQPVLIPG